MVSEWGNKYTNSISNILTEKIVPQPWFPVIFQSDCNSPVLLYSLHLQVLLLPAAGECGYNDLLAPVLELLLVLLVLELLLLVSSVLVVGGGGPEGAGHGGSHPRPDPEMQNEGVGNWVYTCIYIMTARLPTYLYIYISRLRNSSCTWYNLTYFGSSLNRL